MYHPNFIFKYKFYNLVCKNVFYLTLIKYELLSVIFKVDFVGNSVVSFSDSELVLNFLKNLLI